MEKLIKQIKSELAFLNGNGIKDLVHEADLECCHEKSRTIESRKRKLKKQLNDIIRGN